MRRKKSAPTSKRDPASANGAVSPSDVLTLDEAAGYLRVSAGDVVRMIESESLPGRKFGTQWRFSRAALQDWLSHPPQKGLLAHLGRVKADPFLDEMLRDIYQRRGRPEAEEP
jgi:excisionase family DNA binding protein